MLTAEVAPLFFPLAKLLVVGSISIYLVWWKLLG